MWILCSTALGFLLDLCFGDPRWLPHPVVLIGKSISRLERFRAGSFPRLRKGNAVPG
ncbi:MAG: cobalamin biosynthesis protein [Ruminococcus callidus]